MAAFHEVDGGLEWHGRHEVLRVEPWGEDSVRVRAGLARVRDDVPGALVVPAGAPALVDVTDAGARLVAARLAAEVTPAGMLRFARADTGAELVAEEPAHFWWPGPRLFA